MKVWRYAVFWLNPKRPHIDGEWVHDIIIPDHFIPTLRADLTPHFIEEVMEEYCAQNMPSQGYKGEFEVVLDMIYNVDDFTQSFATQERGAFVFRYLKQS